MHIADEAVLDLFLCHLGGRLTLQLQDSVTRLFDDEEDEGLIFSIFVSR